MKRKVRLSILLPAALSVYLVVMVVLGWDSFVAGATSPLLYFGGTVIVAGCIVLLHFHLKRNENKRHPRQ